MATSLGLLPSFAGAVSSALAATDAAAPAEPNHLRSALIFGAIIAVGLPLLLLWARAVRPIHLALGFGTTAALWAISYVALLQPGFVAGEALVVLMLAVLFAAGFIAGRHVNEGVRPLSVGLVSATANLLVVGAFLRDDVHGSKLTPILWIVGLYAASALLAWAGGAVGRTRPATRPLPEAAPLFAAVTAGTMLILIILGGIVTGADAGLAVPDWPNTFGHNMLLYPAAEMRGGVLYEHAHRLYGMLVGATSAVLVSVVWRSAAPRWTRAASVVVLVAVCVQGFLGAMRITGAPTLTTDRAALAPSLAFAIVHGVFAQLVLAFTLVVAAGTTRAWRAAATPIAAAWSGADRTFATIVPVLFAIQLTVGACYRHIPGHPTWAFHLHVTMAVLVLVAVIAAGARAWSHRAHPILVRLGKGLLHGTVAQIAMGIVALVAVWSQGENAAQTWHVVITTCHQAFGALLLGLATLLAVWSRRLLAASPSVAPLTSAV